MAEDGGWVAKEFSNIDFGDQRLNSRFLKTAEAIAAQPLSSIHHACGNWANAKGAYRLFSNEKIHVEEILSSHAARTVERMEGYSRVLVVQDTSYLSFDTHRKTEGLGAISSNGRHQSLGLVMHTSLALSEEGLSLGLVDQQIWARPKQPKRSVRHVYRQIPIDHRRGQEH